MRELRGDTKGDGLAQSPRDPGTATVAEQPRPLDRPGTEAEEAADKPGLDEGTTAGLSQSS